MLWSPPTVPTIFPRESQWETVSWTQALTSCETGFTAAGARSSGSAKRGSGSMLMPAS